MSIELRRSHSRSSDLRPSRAVSFNRDVHIKRYGQKLGKIEEKPENESNMKSRGRGDGNEEKTDGININKEQNKDSIGNRIKKFFNIGKKNEEVKNRYKEYKGDDAGKNAWFRSLERSKKGDRVDPEGNRRHYRYFGESDNETARYATTTSRRHKITSDASTDDATDAELSRYDSLVYLHAPRVRDIPTPRQRTVERKKHLTRSVSLVGPWSPTHRPVSRSGAALVETGTQTISRTPKGRPVQVQAQHQIKQERTKLRDLVFTGPSLDNSSHFRGRI